MVTNNDGKIETDIYYKPTDSKQYLLFNSCHPRHTRTSIPFSLARRLRTIISNESTVKKRMDELKTFLEKQNYPQNIIKTGIEKAMQLETDSLRTVTEKENDNVIPFISTYNPKNPEIFCSIKQNLPILQQDHQMNEIFSNYRFIKSKRQPKNLKKLLTKAKFDETYSTPKVTKCQRPNCGLCQHLIEGSTFTFNCGVIFNITVSMTCEVKNVIYVIQCRGCKKEYIGETGDFLRKRVTIHNQQIRDPNTRMIQVSGHIDTCAHTINPKYYIFPFYKMHIENSIIRKTKELYFIRKFKPQLNSNA